MTFQDLVNSIYVAETEDEIPLKEELFSCLTESYAKECEVDVFSKPCHLLVLIEKSGS